MTKKSSNGSPNPAAKHVMGGTTSVSIVEPEGNEFFAGLRARAALTQIIEAPEGAF